MNPQAAIALPVQGLNTEAYWQNAQKTVSGKGFFNFTTNQVRFLCSIVPFQDQSFCLTKSYAILNEALKCLGENKNVKQIRPLTWAYLRNPGIQKLVLEALNQESRSEDEKRIQKNLWQKYQVLLIPGGVLTKDNIAMHWRYEDLILLESAYQKLQAAVTNSVSPKRLQEFSHLWGAGSAIVRLGDVSINPETKKPLSGQFGEMHWDYPLRIQVVIELQQKMNSPALIAEHLAHENAHANDYLRGNLLGSEQAWSATKFARIFEMCRLTPDYKTSLKRCDDLHPTWFNFHPSDYAAKRSAEYYTKMADEWVRENLQRVPVGRYRCQSKETQALWREMEIN